jgi:hypothetical protein
MLSALPAVAADFLWLSDIHFDPLADRAIVDKLAAIEPAQWAEVLASGAAKFPPYGRDTNWPLFSSLLQATAKQKPKVAFSLVTGDLLVHHFREQFNAAATVHDDQSFRSFVRKSFEFVALELKRRYPGKPVFLTLGNNDDECGDYALQPGGPFLEDTAKAVGDLAGLANIDSYVQLGSYSVPNPAVKHERIVVLNTVFFSPRYSDRCGGQGTVDAGEKLLAWLATQLKSAKSRHEKVWLAYHIPPGVDAFATTHAKQPGTVTLLWKDSYVQRFLSLVQQYEGVVGPNFAGHIHVDDFRLLGGSRKDSPFVMIGPAVSPIAGQNPTFRIVEFDTHGKLKDQLTYYLANLSDTGNGSQPDWRLEYDFEKEWHLKDLNAQSYFSLFTQIGDSPDVAARWTKLYSTSHTGSSIAPGNFRQFYCSSGNITAQAYQSCVARSESNHGKNTN